MPIRGAFLVAPANIDSENAPKELSSFSPVAMKKFSFPSMVIVSSNDPWITVAKGEEYAKAWGSTFRNIGPLGHINPAAGCGEWLEGKNLLKEFLS